MDHFQQRSVKKTQRQPRGIRDLPLVIGMARRFEAILDIAHNEVTLKAFHCPSWSGSVTDGQVK